MVLAALASEYALFPPGHPQLIDRLKRGAPHVERVQFRGHDAWRVDSLSLRREQRRIGVEQHDRPTIPGAIRLLGLSASVLDRKLVIRRNGDGSEAYQWRNRYWREELCMLRTALLFWLLHHASCDPNFSFLSEDGCFLRQTLSDDELNLALPHDDGYPTLSVTINGVVVSATTPAIDDRWEGAPVVSHVGNYHLPADKGLKAQDLAPQLWAYLPQDPDCPVNYTYLATAAYPDNQHLVTNATGKRNAPAWLQAQREVETESKTDGDESAVETIDEIEGTNQEEAGRAPKKKQRRRRPWKGKTKRVGTAKVGGDKPASDGTSDAKKKRSKKKKKARTSPKRNAGPPPPSSLF